MSIIDSILLIFLGATILYLVWVLLSAKLANKAPRENKPRKEQKAPHRSRRANEKPFGASPKEFNVKIRQEEDGVHFIVPSSVAAVQDDGDLFPDIINDVEPDDKGLDLDFWGKIASLPMTEDPEARERLVEILFETGFISEENKAKLAMVSPETVIGEGDAPSAGAASAADAPEEEPIPEPEPEVGPDNAPVYVPAEEEPVPDPYPYPEAPDGNQQEEESDPEFVRDFNI